MKKLLAVAILLVLLAVGSAQAQLGVPGLVKVREVDGSPSGWVYEIVVTNDGLSVSGNTGTISLTAGAGQPVTLDLGDAGDVESADLGEIAVTNDTNSIFTEPSADKLLIDVSKAWPVADQAKTGDSATAFFSEGTIEAAVLPVASAATAGLVPDTSGHADGYVLTVQADGSAEWEEAAAGGATTLAAMTDVSITDAAEANVLIYDGVDTWDNKAVSGDITIAKTGATTIGANKILESMLKAVDSATDEDVLTYESTTGDFEWHSRNEVVTGATVVSPADGSLWDFSGITHSGAATEGLVIPNYANVVPGTDKKYLAADGSNLKLYNGGWVTIGATAAPTDATYLTLSNDATLSAERVITEGLAIDFTDAGANGALTIAFDPTELTGNRTWAAGGAASITWTFDNSGSVDPTFTAGDGLFTFNQAVTVTGALTANGGIVMGTGDGFTVNSVNLLSGDELDGTKIKDADYGDIKIDAAGDWAIEDDSHAHGSTTITLASTNLSDTSALGYLAGANTWTGNNVFGNADTDTLTIRSMIIGGNSRAVQIAATVASPTYATGTNELYVAGDIETAGTIYSASIDTGSGTDGTRAITMATNTALTPAGDQIYFINDALYFSQASVQKTPMRLEDAQTATGKKTFQADIAVGDTSNAGSIDLWDGSANTWTIQTGSQAGDFTLVLPTTAGTTGQYLKTTTSSTTATLSWDTPTASANTDGGTGGVQFNAGGVLTADAGFVFTTASDKLSLGASGGDTTGTLDLYYTGTTYAATLTPNASMSGDVTITMPSYTTTLLGSGANAFTGAITFSGAGTFSAAGATSSVPMVVGTATASGVTGAGAMYFESDTEILTIGDGATSIGLDMAPNVVYTFPSATSTLAALAAPVFTTSIEAPFLILGSAATAADAGTIRMPNAGTILFEADAAGTDIEALSVDSAERVQIAASGSSGVTITPDTTVTGDLTVGGADITLKTDGVKLTGSNGALTILGLGDGQDEDVKIDLNTTANQITISSPASSATAVSLSALNLVTTGSIQGGIKISSDADGMDAAAMTAAGVYGTLFIATGAGTWILPTAAAGMSLCLMDSGTAHDLVLDATAGDTIRLKGAEGADGATITNATGSTTGDFVCVVAVAANKWSTVGMAGTWTVP